jgi:hypothetical protein
LASVETLVPVQVVMLEPEYWLVMPLAQALVGMW